VEDHVTGGEVDNCIVLEEYDDGPFFFGATITAADIAWAPTILVYEDLKPRERIPYPELMEWYDKMERLVACYPC
jgi:glutathione S-transferase